MSMRVHARTCFENRAAANRGAIQQDSMCKSVVMRRHVQTHMPCNGAAADSWPFDSKASKRTETLTERPVSGQRCFWEVMDWHS